MDIAGSSSSYYTERCIALSLFALEASDQRRRRRNMAYHNIHADPHISTS